jgi:hypothetical protein
MRRRTVMTPNDGSTPPLYPGRSTRRRLPCFRLALPTTRSRTGTGIGRRISVSEVFWIIDGTENEEERDLTQGHLRRDSVLVEQTSTQSSMANGPSHPAWRCISRALHAAVDIYDALHSPEAREIASSAAIRGLNQVVKTRRAI